MALAARPLLHRVRAAADCDCGGLSVHHRRRSVRVGIPLQPQQHRPAAARPLSLLAGNGSHSPAGSESQIVVQYMTSRAVIDQLDAALDLHRMFSPPEADWWSRLPRPTSIDVLVQYWRGQVDPFYDPANSTVVVRVRPYKPAEALQLAQAIVAASEQLVNDLSARARHDAVRNGESES